MKKSYIKKLKEALDNELKEHKSSFIVYSILRIAVIVVAILQFYNKNYENVFLCILTLLLFILPSLIQITFKIEIPKTLEIIIYIFIFAAEILGEINDYYLLIPYWDTMLHTINGFLCAAIGFSLVNLLNNADDLEFKLSPLFFVLVSFCFSMTIGILWEFFEFSLDMIMHTDAQKDVIIHSIHSVSLSTNGSVVNIPNISHVTVNGQLLPIEGYLDIGLIDTMKDLFVNFVGAFIFSIFGFIYLKNKERNSILNSIFLFKKEVNNESCE